MEREFSIIIPTLFKRVDILNNLLLNLYHDGAVKEVILIDNSNGFDYSKLERHPKLRTIISGKNIFVNPSWNLGVSLAKYEFIGLLNDDITIPENVFTSLKTIALEKFGVIGTNHPSIQQVETPTRFTVPNFTIVKTPIRNWGFGILMVMYKENYIKIPDGIKIWTGDDIIFHENNRYGRTNAIFTFPVQTKMSSTSDLPEFDSVKENDLLLYENYKTKNKHMRWDLINHLVAKNNYKNYLEVGVQDYESCCAKINTPNKTAVDPAPRNRCDFIGTSDAFFEQLDPSIKYDIVFVDGLHHDDQVLRDIENSLKHLTPDGSIVVHDCLPLSHIEAQRDDYGGPWMGDVYKAIIKLKATREDINISVVDHDCGCGIIQFGKQEKTDVVLENVDFDSYTINKKEWMNIISLDDFYNKY